MPNESKQVVLRTRGITKAFGTTVALCGIDLEIRRGEVLALLGPNGAGKTTFISIVSGLAKPDAGTVLVSGIDVKAHPQRARQHLGLAPQELGIYPVLTVEDNLMLFAQLSGLRGQSVRARVDRIASELDLERLRRRRAGQLSGGERRRLHTAIALVHEPALLLLDEPTVGADVYSRAALLAMVRSLADEGAAVCYTTHYLTEAEAIADVVVVIAHGRLIASGSVNELIAAYGESFVQVTFDRVVSDSNLPGTLDDHTLRIPTESPEQTIAALLPGLLPRLEGVRDIRISRPSLENVYLSLLEGGAHGDKGTA